MDLVTGARALAQGAISFEILPLRGIKNNPHNAREHNRKQLAKLRRSIEKFGFLVPVIVDESGELLCGHARVAAAQELGLLSVPAIRASHLGEADKRAFIIADNRLAELASWNEKALRRELSFLSELDIDYDFAALGFNTAEVDFILDADDCDCATLPAPAVDTPPVSRGGDLWLLGEHRLYCGSALDASSYRALLKGDRANLVFTDPPYNVRIDGHVGGGGTIKHREFAMASGEMSDDQFITFLQTALDQIERSAADGAICFVCMDWRHTQQLLLAARNLTLKNICVWVKNNGGMGSLYRSQHEFIFVLKCGAAEHINNVELGRHGRNRTNVWEYRGINSFGRDRDELLKSHPTVKPVALVADAIKDCSKRGDLVLDPFGGSGTTLIAAEKTKRRAALIELDPHYVDTIVRRWQAFTGKEAICATTGATFAKREAIANALDAATADQATDDGAHP
jgi:DNA modification methylase